MIQAIMALLGIGGQTLEKWQERQLIKEQSKTEIAKIKAQGKVDHAKALATVEANYDNIAQMAMKTSWKDEYLVIILTVPFLVSFFTPYIAVLWGIDLTAQLTAAWTLVGTAPDWYQWSFMGVIIATFGLRWMVKHDTKSILKKGK